LYAPVYFGLLEIEPNIMHGERRAHTKESHQKIGRRFFLDISRKLYFQVRVGFYAGRFAELKIEKRSNGHDYQEKENQKYDQDICSSLHVSSCFLDH
jgi:hypothetical protein